MAMVNRHGGLTANFVFVSTTGFTGFLGELSCLLDAKAVFLGLGVQGTAWMAVRMAVSGIIFLARAKREFLYRLSFLADFASFSLPNHHAGV